MKFRGMPSQELVHRWKKRRREILNTLPPELLAEYQQLGKAIKRVWAEEMRNLSEVSQTLHSSTTPATANRVRIPLSFHRKKLIEFLDEHGPSLRAEIVAKTGIPEGSLSKLLRGKEFEHLERGFWALEWQAKKSKRKTKGESGG